MDGLLDTATNIINRIVQNFFEIQTFLVSQYYINLLFHEKVRKSLSNLFILHEKKNLQIAGSICYPFFFLNILSFRKTSGNLKTDFEWAPCKCNSKSGSDSQILQYRVRANMKTNTFSVKSG